MHDSLFGHLVSRFASKPENLATDAVCYILERYPVAATAFVGFLRNMGINLGGTITFRTQSVGSQDSVPDLVGSDSEGRRPIIAEAKFWAGLTDHQPVTYIGELPPDSDGVLLFIAPRMRFTTLWPELVERCKKAAIPIGPDIIASGEVRSRKVGTRHVLAITSWRAVLAVILEALEAEGNQTGAADVRQIQGLCERMDSEAFLPLCSEEMSPQIARRTVQYCRLVSEVADALWKEGVGLWKNVGSSMSTASHGRYVILENHGCFLQFNPDLWARKRCTPLWLGISGKDWKPIPAATTAALVALESEDPPRLIRDGSQVLVPLTIALGVELDAVVNSLVFQIREIVALLRKADSDAASAA